MVVFIRRIALDVLFGVVLLFRGLLCSAFRVVGWLTLLCLLLPSLPAPPLTLEDRAKCPIIGRGAALLGAVVLILRSPLVVTSVLCWLSLWSWPLWHLVVMVVTALLLVLCVWSCRIVARFIATLHLCIRLVASLVRPCLLLRTLNRLSRLHLVEVACPVHRCSSVTARLPSLHRAPCRLWPWLGLSVGGAAPSLLRPLPSSAWNWLSADPRLVRCCLGLLRCVGLGALDLALRLVVGDGDLAALAVCVRLAAPLGPVSAGADASLVLGVVRLMVGWLCALLADCAGLRALVSLRTSSSVVRWCRWSAYWLPLGLVAWLMRWCVYPTVMVGPHVLLCRHLVNWFRTCLTRG